MAHDESVLSELLSAVKGGDGTDLIRELAQWALQQLIDTEATGVIGAGRYERTDTRSNERNGTRPKVLSTATGDLQVGIPKLRKGSFFPSVLEPRRRIDQALHAVIMEAYVSGVSTRSVDDLVGAMGVQAGISRSEVSRICSGLDERVAAFRNRTLGHVGFPYVFLDATYVHVRDDALGQVVSRAVVVATGVTSVGGREVLGVDIGDSEDETFWTGFLRSLTARGLAGVRLVVSDAHAGLKAAIAKVFQGASWQRSEPEPRSVDVRHHRAHKAEELAFAEATEGGQENLVRIEAVALGDGGRQSRGVVGLVTCFSRARWTERGARARRGCCGLALPAGEHESPDAVPHLRQLLGGPVGCAGRG